MKKKRHIFQKILKNIKWAGESVIFREPKEEEKKSKEKKLIS